MRKFILFISPSFLAARGTQLVLLTLALTAAIYAKAAISPLQETLQVAMRLSDNQVALIQGPALALPGLIAAIPIGLFIDRYSRVRLILAFFVLILISSILTAQAGHFATLFVARTLMGLAVFAVLLPAPSLIADWYVPAQRGRANMVLLIGQFIAVSIAFAVGGALVITPSWGIDAWRWTLLWMTIPPLVLMTIVLFALREPPRTGRLIEKPSMGESFIELWRYRLTAAPLVVGQGTAILALASVMIWAAPALTRMFTLAPDRVGFIMAVVAPVGGISGTIGGGVLADLCQRTGGPRRTISFMAALALACVPASLFGLMPAVLAASAALTLLIALLTALVMMGGTLIVIVLPNELRGLATGVLGALAMLLTGLAPLMVSALTTMLGDSAKIGVSVSAVCLMGSLLAFAALAFGRQHFPAKSAHEPVAAASDAS